MSNVYRELTKAVEPFIKQEDEGKFRCKTCLKLFKATSFVEKHIANKHPDLVKHLEGVRVIHFSSQASDISLANRSPTLIILRSIHTESNLLLTRHPLLAIARCLPRKLMVSRALLTVNRRANTVAQTSHITATSTPRATRLPIPAMGRTRIHMHTHTQLLLTLLHPFAETKRQ